MDTGKGTFETLLSKQRMEELEQKYPDHGGWFHVGETIEIRGSFFRIKSVKPTELRLKLLPKSKKGENK